MTENANPESECVEKTPELKQKIPCDVSGVAYVTTTGIVRYCTTGVGRELPKDFKNWLNLHRDGKP